MRKQGVTTDAGFSVDFETDPLKTENGSFRLKNWKKVLSEWSATRLNQRFMTNEKPPKSNTCRRRKWNIIRSTKVTPPLGVDSTSCCQNVSGRRAGEIIGSSIGWGREKTVVFENQTFAILSFLKNVPFARSGATNTIFLPKARLLLAMTSLV